MVADEIRGSASLALQAAGGVVSVISETHHSIALRTFRTIGPVAAPVRRLHDAISGGVYAAVSAGLKATAATTSVALRAAPLPSRRGLTASPAGRAALAALNGAIGDQLAESGNPLAIPMSLIREAAPAGGMATVFIHGLMESDLSWMPRGDPAAGFGELLRSELGLTPVYARYNTGLSVAASGLSLARALDDLERSWPVPLTRLCLVGHSMGGLVARSACHQGKASGFRWPEIVTDVVCLGTPHLGAPLEKLAHAGQAILQAIPETRALARLISIRSAGIRDLRHGIVPDDSSPEPVHLPGVAHHFAAATVGQNPQGAAAWLLGDLLVRYPSAIGHGRGRGLEALSLRHFGGLHHFDLLSHPLVYRQLRDWLGAGDRGPRRPV